MSIAGNDNFNWEQEQDIFARTAAFPKLKLLLMIGSSTDSNLALCFSGRVSKNLLLESDNLGGHRSRSQHRCREGSAVAFEECRVSRAVGGPLASD
jgi:hypothetical protein